MPIDWGKYQSFDPEIDRPLDEVTRKQARRHFEKLMAEKEERIEALAALCRRNGCDPGRNDAAVQRLNDWFRVNVEGDPHKPGRLLPLWYAVVNDIGLYLGERLIEDAPHLSWTLYTWGAKNISYQRPVVMGFTKVKNPKYNVDFDRLAGIYGHRVVGGQPVDEEEFVKLLKHCRSLA